MQTHNIKKMMIFSLAGLLFVCCEKTVTTTVNVPDCSIALNLSNTLPDGNLYGTVGLALLPNACSPGHDGVQIVVDADQNILIPKANFGIQKFGFNYSGDADELEITTNGNWVVRKNRNISEFGKFSIELSGNGYTRQDPLIITICNSRRDVTEADFAVGNKLGYVFAVHIADFIYPGYFLWQSAYFSSTETCSYATTTVIPTTTVPQLSTTTTAPTAIPTTTTADPAPTTTTSTSNTMPQINVTTTINIMPVTTTSVPTSTVPQINVTTTINIMPVTTTSVPTTVINMSVFKATPGDRKVTLMWVTESEVDNQGFNIYRGETEDGEYEKINNLLIPAQGSATEGASYSATDDGLQNRKIYYYQIEDVDSSGMGTFHGPVKATPLFIYRMVK